MKENNTLFEKIIFWFELALFLVIPFVVWWSTTPTNVLNSSSLYKLLETVGIWGSGIFLLIGIPAGIIGIIKAKRMTKLKKRKNQWKKNKKKLKLKITKNMKK